MLLQQIIKITPILILFSCAPATQYKQNSLELILEDYQLCKKNSTVQKGCKSFTAKAICDFYGINDFIVDDVYVEQTKLYDIVLNNGKWAKLGWANNQEVLTKAQQYANDHNPVIAVKTDDPNYFTVLVVPGTAQFSQKWQLEVPITAAFFPLSSNMEAFLDKGLNYVWSDAEKVTIFIRR